LFQKMFRWILHSISPKKCAKIRIIYLQQFDQFI
jgi:hypothetical protein